MQIDKVEAGRAEIAFRFAKAGANIAKRKDYRSHVRKFPSMVLTNGLTQAVVFAYSKAGKEKVENLKNPASPPNSADPWALVYRQMEQYLRGSPFALIDANKLLVDQLVEMESPEYRMVEQDVLAFCNWLRRFAEALIEAEDES
ncbi:MAG: type III-B CRISPR module-associated protein Cmr5 [Planctomycetota bacterium]|nr:MAG: type III-B CRISPR module-associated protein Cmr5 [Planctomycetota bacterium]